MPLGKTLETLVRASRFSKGVSVLRDSSHPGPPEQQPVFRLSAVRATWLPPRIPVALPPRSLSLEKNRVAGGKTLLDS